MLVGTGLALAAATVWVPVGCRLVETWYSIGEVRSDPREYGYTWVWAAPAGAPGAARRWSTSSGRSGPRWEWTVYWPGAIAGQALVLLLGGGLLTWVVRRERRRAVGAT